MHNTARTAEQAHLSQQMAKAECCKLMSACFYPPEKTMLLAEPITDMLTSQLGIVCPEAVPTLPYWENCLQDEDPVAPAVAYTRLFLGPPEVLAPPYASFYLDGRGTVMGPSMVEMTKMYDAMGLRLDEEFFETPDHVTVVLEFLYFLFFRSANAEMNESAQAKDRIDRTIDDFVTRFVKPWIPRFCRLVVQADQHPFYNGVAHYLEAFVRHGLKEIGEP